MRILTALLLLRMSAYAQEPLSLKAAVARALAGNHHIKAAEAGQAMARTRIAQARAGYLPRLSYSETFARGDNPVFVFGSLLTQHQFSERNFALGPLNRPDALNNFQSMVVAEQTVYDAGQTRSAVRSAELGHGMGAEEARRARMETIAAVVRSYFGAVMAEESWKTAREAVRSAEADLDRAQAVRAAGMSTDADVLSIRVHLAAVNEQRIRRAADLEVARAALNDAVALPLDQRHTLVTALAAADIPDTGQEDLERTAAAGRPEARQAQMAANMARVGVETARASLLPQVAVRSVVEADRQRFINRAGANWLASVSLRWNLFNGGSDKARIEEASLAVRRAEAERERADSGIRLQVRRAYAGLRAAVQRIEVAKAAMAEAAESLRIIQNRYAAGMSNVTDLLRTETAALESKTRYLAAVHDQRIAATELELAAGTLTEHSAVLN